MEIAIYGESCVMAGQSVSQAKLDGYDGDWRDGGDWTVYDGTPEELLAEADSLPGCRNRTYDEYYHRVARTIREAVYSERPDLRPAEVAEDDE
jgi:hypothetical protein